MSPAWAAIVAWLKELWPDIQAAIKLLGAGLLGQELQRGSDAQQALDDVEKAARAAAGVELLSDPDVVRDLKERSLYRVSGK